MVVGAPLDEVSPSLLIVREKLATKGCVGSNLRGQLTLPTSFRIHCSTDDISSSNVGTGGTGNAMNFSGQSEP
jgi:hypothetical protein